MKKIARSLLSEAAYPSVSNKERIRAEEDLRHMTRTVLTRAETRAEAEQLFGQMGESSRKSRKTIEKLFVQAPGAETMSPQLAKTASTKTASVTANLEAFFEKNASAFDGLTDAQRRFPELLKVASSRKPMKKTSNGEVGCPTPVQPMMSGGQA